MGFSVSWVAVKGLNREVVLDRLMLDGTGDFEMVPESPTVAATLPSGHVIVVDSAFHITDDTRLSALSADHELVLCIVDERSMVSSLAVWNDGESVWQVRYNSNVAADELEFDGDLPLDVRQLRDRVTFAPSQAESLFEVPLDLAESLTSYRHDKDIELTDSGGYEVLRYRIMPEPTPVVSPEPEASPAPRGKSPLVVDDVFDNDTEPGNGVSPSRLEVMGLISFILALTALPASGCCIIVGVPCQIAAIVLGVLSLRKHHQEPHNWHGKVLAILGLVFSGLMVLATCVLVAIYLVGIVAAGTGVVPDLGSGF